MSEGMKTIEELLTRMTPAQPAEEEVIRMVAIMLAVLIDANNGSTLVTTVDNDTHIYKLTMTREEK